MLLIPSAEYERKAGTQVLAKAYHAEHILYALITCFRLSTFINLLDW